MVTSLEDTKDEFLTRMLSGEDAAYEEFVQTHSGRMLSVAKRLLRDEHLAADAVQEGFLSAFRALGRFKRNSSLGTWLHRIVVNVCLMKLRSRGNQTELSLDDLLPKFDHTGHHVKSVAAWGGISRDSADVEESREVVRRCIDQLPDAYRTIVILRDIEELDTDEAAKMLEISTAVVKTRLHRARQALRTLLEPYFT